MVNIAFVDIAKDITVVLNVAVKNNKIGHYVGLFGTYFLKRRCLLRLKGAVSRDFLPLYFFINRTHLGP